MDSSCRNVCAPHGRRISFSRSSVIWENFLVLLLNYFSAFPLICWIIILICMYFPGLRSQAHFLAVSELDYRLQLELGYIPLSHCSPLYFCQRDLGGKHLNQKERVCDTAGVQRKVISRPWNLKMLSDVSFIWVAEAELCFHVCFWLVNIWAVFSDWNVLSLSRVAHLKVKDERPPHWNLECFFSFTHACVWLVFLLENPTGREEADYLFIDV